MQESHSNTIKMDKFEPRIVAQLVKFLYTGDYNDYEHRHEDPMKSASGQNGQGMGIRPSRNHSEELTNLLLCKEANTQVSVAEDKNISSLSAEPLPPAADPAASLIHHVHVNCIGEFYAIDSLVSLANTKIKNLIDAQGHDKSWVSYLPFVTEVALESTGDDGLLNILASASAENMEILIDRENFSDLNAVSDFSLRVLRYSNQKIRNLTESMKRVEGQLAELGTKSALEAYNHEEKTKGGYISPEERILRSRKCRRRH